MRRNMVETVMGGVVLIVAALFLTFAYNYTGAGAGASDRYELWGRFDRVDGLQLGSDVKIGGITVGTVLEQTLDMEGYLATVRWNVDADVKLTTDTVAEIASDGLIGGKYLALVPGGEDSYLEPGGEIEFTQPPVDLLELLGKMLLDRATEDK
ncbi:outer membrane lipid asymmetry maintenance protein MlaD [Rhodospirillaceae bacterium AH-315-P19]|nr:outer membrane lipid asymmetry maintenance protein MlaD [Rhodospirillaceae bacterium AH-315-P19]